MTILERMTEIEKEVKKLEELIGNGTNITDEVMKVAPKHHRSTVRLTKKCTICGKEYKYGKSFSKHINIAHF